MQRTIALVDCNNFYVSCERLFQPWLNNKPVVVLSNNDGCVVSRSPEAKNLGIKMAVPWHQVKHFSRQHGLVARSSNYSLYADISNRVMRLLAQFSPTQEIYSIDECFLDLTGMPLPASPTDYGQQMRQAIRQCVGMPICVGIASSKTLAKLANHVAKSQPDLQGVCDFNSMQEVDLNILLGTLPVSAVWGVGQRTAHKLQQMDIQTVLDLKRTSPRVIRDQFSVVLERTVDELNGIACLEIDDIAAARQQIICSRSFGSLVLALPQLEQATIAYTTRAAEKLRHQQSLAGGIHVYIRTNPNKKNDPQYQQGVMLPLQEPTADTRLLCHAALAGLRQIFRTGYAYQKVGIMLTGIIAEAARPCSLFTDTAAQQKSDSLMRTLDHINRRMGHGTVQLLGEGTQKNWAMRRDYMSNRYTTEWEELAVALST